MGANSGQKVVTLTLDQMKEPGVTSPSVAQQRRPVVKSSQSSLSLKGAWSERTVFTPITTPEAKGQ